MIQYVVKRTLYAVPILLGVNILTFALFFMVNSPDDIAYVHLGGKHVTQADLDSWKLAHGYHLPLFKNDNETGLAQFQKTIFWTKSIRLFLFDFGISDSGRDISHAISERFWPSLFSLFCVSLGGVKYACPTARALFSTS